VGQAFALTSPNLGTNRQITKINRHRKGKKTQNFLKFPFGTDMN
jgi:hypothetical protein